MSSPGIRAVVIAVLIASQNCLCQAQYDAYGYLNANRLASEKSLGSDDKQPELTASAIEEPSLQEANSSSEEESSREGLFGNWLGTQSRLAERGIEVESSLTQFYQGVASGGANQVFRYGGKLDLVVEAETERLGWWQGGKLTFHAAEWQFGQNIIEDATPLAPVNLDQLAPTPEASFAVTMLMLHQDLGNGYAAMLGRYNLLDLWEGFYPDYGLGQEGFMNVSVVIPFNVVVPTLPSVSNLVGIVNAEERGLRSGLFVIENQNSPTTPGWDYPNGVTLAAFGKKYTEIGGLAGSHMIISTYGTGNYTALELNGWISTLFGLTSAPINRNSWAAGYIGEQRLWQDAYEEKRYGKLQGYLGFADESTNPFSVTAGLAIEGFGCFQNRPEDRLGIGYFYSGLSNDFQTLLNVLEPVGDLHGGEVYYNAKITDWFQLTADLQAIRPGIRSQDTALVFGLRGKIDF